MEAANPKTLLDFLNLLSSHARLRPLCEPKSSYRASGPRSSCPAPLVPGRAAPGTPPTPSAAFPAASPDPTTASYNALSAPVLPRCLQRLQVLADALLVVVDLLRFACPGGDLRVERGDAVLLIDDLAQRVLHGGIDRPLPRKQRDLIVREIRQLVAALDRPRLVQLERGLRFRVGLHA